MSLTIQGALSTIDELLLGDDSILVQIRGRQGLDEARYLLLLQAIDVLIEHYREQDRVPKRLALAFVDISNYFYYSDAYYSREELDRLEDAGQKLTQLASRLFT